MNNGRRVFEAMAEIQCHGPTGLDRNKVMVHEGPITHWYRAVTDDTAQVDTAQVVTVFLYCRACASLRPHFNIKRGPVNRDGTPYEEGYTQ